MISPAADEGSCIPWAARLSGKPCVRVRQAHTAASSYAPRRHDQYEPNHDARQSRRGSAARCSTRLKSWMPRFLWFIVTYLRRRRVERWERPVNEAEYKLRFSLISDQISGATRAFYTYIEINKFAGKNTENYQKINRDGHFWSGQLYALQTTWFIIFGRIFDPTRGAYSIHDFLKSTVAYKGLFSRDALADRKRIASGQAEPEWLDGYVKAAWEPTTEDLKKIRATVEASDAKWKKVYQPIRNKVFAYTDPKAVVEDLFRDTLVGDIEDILHDLNKIRTAVFQLIENGRQHWIEDGYRGYADLFISDTRALLSRL